MNILGLNVGHDSSLSLLSPKGELIFAGGEERVNRRKAFTGFPSRFLSLVGHKKYHIAVAGEARSWREMEERWCDYLFGSEKNYFDIFNELSYSYLMGSKKQCDGEPLIRDRFLEAGIEIESLSFHDHHLCHAASAYYTSGFDDALVVTVDGAGDGKSATAHAVNAGRWDELGCTRLPHSAGHMYGWVTRMLGFKVSRHEGKITGLAAYGDSARLERLRGQLLRINPDSETFENPYVTHGNLSLSVMEKAALYRDKKPIYPTYEAFRRLVEKEYGDAVRKEDIAALAQEELEQAVTAWIAGLIKKTGLRKVAMAGGVFANVKLNQRIAALEEVEEIWIFPDMGDGGLSAGAALLSLRDRLGGRLRSTPLHDVYLGPSYGEDEIRAAVDEAGLVAVRKDDVALETARLLAEKVVVGWFQGRMEYGPRALGHRSILLHPGDRDMNDVMNKRLNRTEFMPFAPSVLYEYAEELFDNWSKSRHASEFMTVTYDVNPAWVDKLSAVVHIDNTARPQVVRRDREERYWRVIDEFRKLTGLPAIVNTSFNMHEEPIVCTPSDAIRSFKHGAVDVLVLGDYMVTR